MINIKKIKFYGFGEAFEGMRLPMKSERDGYYPLKEYYIDYIPGDDDLRLARNLANAGGSEAKYRRMITVYMTIEAPLYWWKEFDTYKVGTVANSESTMHTLSKRDLTIEDFSTDKLIPDNVELMENLIKNINKYRTTNKSDWYQMIQLLPSSFNQTRKVMMNYEVLARIYKERRHHKLDEWKKFCIEIERLPYSSSLIL